MNELLKSRLYMMSDEYRSLMKSYYEYDLMNRYIKSQEYIQENAIDDPEYYGLYTEGFKDTVTNIKNTVVDKGKKLLIKMGAAIIKLIGMIVSLIDRIIDRFKFANIKKLDSRAKSIVDKYNSMSFPQRNHVAIEYNSILGRDNIKAGFSLILDGEDVGGIDLGNVTIDEVMERLRIQDYSDEGIKNIKALHDINFNTTGPTSLSKIMRNSTPLLATNMKLRLPYTTKSIKYILGFYKKMESLMRKSFRGKVSEEELKSELGNAMAKRMSAEDENALNSIFGNSKDGYINVASFQKIVAQYMNFSDMLKYYMGIVEKYDNVGKLKDIINDDIKPMLDSIKNAIGELNLLQVGRDIIYKNEIVYISELEKVINKVSTDSNLGPDSKLGNMEKESDDRFKRTVESAKQTKNVSYVRSDIADMLKDAYIEGIPTDVIDKKVNYASSRLPNLWDDTKDVHQSDYNRSDWNSNFFFDQVYLFEKPGHFTMARYELLKNIINDEKHSW